ncbi:hypothetical protein BJV82DRAFT_573720 [Fennellomyces sp. T-0311]|nr:hypothetical protein BJV82DRAFT_573720 [Fennellomyces sp. T-0311]
MPQVEVKWAGKRFQLEFSQEQLETATVKDLKDKCYESTHVDPARMKLMAYGAVMKNNEQRVSTYGVRDGSKLILMAAPAKADEVPGAAEGQLLAQISETTKKLNEKIVPDIESYERRVKEFVSKTAPKQPKEQQKLVEYGVYLNEQLMQILFDFDKVVCGVEFEKARQQRKEGVRQCQALLDKVDSIKALVKTV